MKNFICWLEAPYPISQLILLWLGFTILVFSLWVLIPLSLGVEIYWKYLSINLSIRNIAIVTSISFGEEFVFRVFPVFAFILLFPQRIGLALIAGACVAFPFAFWHSRPFIIQVCLGTGGIILTIAYLKFGGAKDRPFTGILACGGTHTFCNLAVASIANIFG